MLAEQTKTGRQLNAARVAVQLGRQPKAYAMMPDEVARDAVAMVRHALAARRALERQAKPDSHLAAAREIARRYDALVAEPDINGVVVALKFRSGLYSSGFRNLFVVV